MPKTDSRPHLLYHIPPGWKAAPVFWSAYAQELDRTRRIKQLKILFPDHIWIPADKTQPPGPSGMER